MLVMVPLLLHVLQAFSALTELVSNTNILVQQVLFRREELRLKLIVQVVQAETIVEKEDFLTQTTRFVHPRAIFALLEQLKDQLAPLDKQPQMELLVQHAQQINSVSLECQLLNARQDGPHLDLLVNV